MTRLRSVVLAVAAAVITVVVGLGSAGAADAYGPYYVANTLGLRLRIRATPHLNAKVIGSLAPGEVIPIVCQTTGDEVNSTSDIWDGLSSGGYVSDYYTTTPAIGTWTDGIPHPCQSPSPSPSPSPSGSPSPAPQAPNVISPFPIPSNPSPPTSEPNALALGLEGVNWAAPGDNYSTGPVVPTGLRASDDRRQTYNKALKILGQLQSQGVKTVRLPINPATVLDNINRGSTWWNSYQGTIDAAIHLNMNVILSYWNADGKDGPGYIDDTPGLPILGCSDPSSPYARFNEMWRQVVGTYARDSRVYFEIMNEPWGYPAAAWDSLAEQWLQCYQVPNQFTRHRVIVSAAFGPANYPTCTGVQTDLGDVASDHNLDGTLLSLHFYDFNSLCPFSNDEGLFKKWMNSASYRGRVVVDEFGTSVGSNDFTQPSADGHVQYMQDLIADLEKWGMGAVYWAGIKGCYPAPSDSCDSYSLWRLDSSDNLHHRGNGSLIELLQPLWGMPPLQHAKLRKRHRPPVSCRAVSHKPKARTKRTSKAQLHPSTCQVHNRSTQRRGHRAKNAHPHRSAKVH